MVESGSLYGVEGPTIPFPSFIAPLALLLFVSPVLLLIAIVFDVLSAVRGGPDRAASIVGGLLLLTTPLAFLIFLLGYGL
jgi:hypothetical protein